MFARLKRAIIFRIINSICLFFHYSYRYRIYNREHRERAEGMQSKKAFAIASWHQNCFAGILAHSHQGIALLVSKSFDGEIVSRVARCLGLVTVRGSSKKGGNEALNVLIERTKEGLRSAITIDGPKGPIFQVKRGIFVLSAETGAPILPLLTVGRSYWTLRSWDLFRIPKPFSEVSVIYGKPFKVTRDEVENSLDELKERLALEMHELEREAISRGLCPTAKVPSRASGNAPTQQAAS